MKKYGSCEKEPECTVSQTGTCFFQKRPLESCDFYAAPEEAEEGDEASNESNEELKSFHSGQGLTLSEARALANETYAHLIGLLGEFDVGKTSLVASIYVLAAHRMLTDFTFKSSLTIPALEERAEFARSWVDGKPGGAPPHTVLGDKEFPPLLHLALMSGSEPVHLLFTDLPGEWTEELVARADAAAQFQFLHRCDCILIALDCKKLQDLRESEVRRLKILFERLASMQLDPDIPIFLVLTKFDLVGQVVPPAVDDILRDAQKIGYKPSIATTAAWSKTNGVAPGSGVPALIKNIVSAGQFRLKLSKLLPESGTRHFHAVGVEYGE